MNRTAITETMVDRVVQLLVPGASARMSYSGEWDEFVIGIKHDGKVLHTRVSETDLLMSIDDFSALLKSKVPAEWLPKP